MSASSQTSLIDTRASHPGVPTAWPLRILFALCCAVVVFMAVHGDEHGRRPRFVWQSAIEASKAAILQTTDVKREGAALGAGPHLAAIMAPPGVLPAAAEMRDFRPARLEQAAPARPYLRPFSNAPPIRA
ncbi:hypothetical protein [Parvibaculum sp.]|uniref:hypothetical protein n=1 Tax=Parvibaculum sp. TaxID=2024848 RepID=UPI00320EC7CA